MVWALTYAFCDLPPYQFDRYSRDSAVHVGIRLQLKRAETNEDICSRELMCLNYLAWLPFSTTSQIRNPEKICGVFASAQPVALLLSFDDIWVPYFD